ncbi:receptor-type protein kinase, putative, partial [Bodo saltans]
MPPKVHSRAKTKRSECSYPLAAVQLTAHSPRRFARHPTVIFLQHICLFGSGSITDVGLLSVAMLQQLRHIDLTHCTKITDAGLMTVAALQHLQHLDLLGCQNITDDGLADVASPRQLQQLVLSCCS